jgi:hypothetical protein
MGRVLFVPASRSHAAKLIAASRLRLSADLGKLNAGKALAICWH